MWFKNRRAKWRKKERAASAELKSGLSSAHHLTSIMQQAVAAASVSTFGAGSADTYGHARTHHHLVHPASAVAAAAVHHEYVPI